MNCKRKIAKKNALCQLKYCVIFLSRGVVVLHLFYVTHHARVLQLQ